MSKFKILIVDDHRIFREGLAFIISHMKEYEVAGEAHDGLSFLEIIERIHADIVLMDIVMPGIDGISATARALKKYPGLKVIALTMFCDKEYYNKMLKAGVSGFLLKESGKDELKKALDAVISGEKYYSQKLLHNIIKPSGSILRKPEIKAVSLSREESQILNLICQGYSTLSISEKLSISIRMVDSYKLQLMDKTGSKNPLGLAVFAMKNKLVDI